MINSVTVKKLSSFRVDSFIIPDTVKKVSGLPLEDIQNNSGQCLHNLEDIISFYSVKIDDCWYLVYVCVCVCVCVWVYCEWCVCVSVLWVVCVCECIVSGVSVGVIMCFVVCGDISS